MASRVPDLPPTTERAIVVGAGIAGLTAAFRLRQQGFDVTVLEAGPTIGGRMASVRRDGFVINTAAHILPASYAALTALVRDLGLQDEVTRITGRIGVLRDGTVHGLRTNGPGMLGDGLRTSLLSPRSKLLLRRLAVDALRMKSSLSYENLGAAQRFDTESAAEYCARRLNDEIRDYLVEPLCRGLFTSNADRVSVVDFFFAAVNFIGAGLLRYPGGVDFICEAIAGHVDVRTSSRVVEVERHDDGATVRWRAGDTEHTERVSACVISVSGKQVAGIYPQVDKDLAKIFDEHLDYATTFAASFALRARPDQDAMVVTVPSSEDANLCVITVDHNFQPDAAPSGKGLISSFWLHDWNREHLELADAELVDLMLPSLEKVLPGVTELVEFYAVYRWDPAVVRSYPGVYRHVAEIADRIDPAHRVQLAGDYLTASSTNGSAVSGDLAAARLVASVHG